MDERVKNRRKIKSYVVRGGRLSNLQRNALEKFSATYCIEFRRELLQFDQVFSHDGPVIIEIGFGMGVTTAAIASAFRDTNYLGIEVHTPGVGKLLSEMDRYGLDNIRIIQHDAVEVLETMIPDESVDGFHIFFPDPWPKKRHHKRRLIQEPFVRLLTSKLKTGGYLYSVTDWEPYAEQMAAVYSATPSLHNPYGGYADPIPWRPKTKFEKKGLDKSYSIKELWVEKI